MARAILGDEMRDRFESLRTPGAPDAVQSLAASGVPLEMIAVINQTWSTRFASRTDLAIRFSRLISAPWALPR